MRAYISTKTPIPVLYDQNNSSDSLSQRRFKLNGISPLASVLRPRQVMHYF
jgi:hypothetical protein